MFHFGCLEARGPAPTGPFLPYAPVGMRILFTSIRNIGHFQPLVPLIEACRGAGHEVAVGAPPDLEARVHATGARFVPFGHPGDEGLRPLWEALRELPHGEQNGFVISRIFAGACAEAAVPLLLTHAREFQPDVIVREAQEYAGLLVGQALGVPTARVAISLERALHRFFPLLMPALDQQRGALGLALDPTGQHLAQEPILTQFPKALWHEESAQPLFRFGVPSREHPGPLPIERPPAWGDDRTPLVYLTLGTVAGGMADLRRGYRLLLDAVASLPVRALLTTGEAVDPASLGAIPEHVAVARFVPQARVLAHARAVVCHGGSGTVLGALSAGLPLVIMPMFADQPENAREVEAAGAGLGVPFGDASPDRIASALTRVLGEPTFAQRAQAIAREMSTLPPVESAPNWLAQVCSRTNG